MATEIETEDTGAATTAERDSMTVTGMRILANNEGTKSYGYIWFVGRVPSIFSMSAFSLPFVRVRLDTTIPTHHRHHHG